MRFIRRLLIILITVGWIAPLCASFWAIYGMIWLTFQVANGFEKFGPSWHPFSIADKLFYFSMAWLACVIIGWSVALTKER